MEREVAKRALNLEPRPRHRLGPRGSNQAFEKPRAKIEEETSTKGTTGLKDDHDRFSKEPDADINSLRLPREFSTNTVMGLCKEYTEIAISPEIDPLSWSILKSDLSIPSVIMQAINSNSSVLVGLDMVAGLMFQ